MGMEQRWLITEIKISTYKFILKHWNQDVTEKRLYTYAQLYTYIVKWVTLYECTSIHVVISSYHISRERDRYFLTINVL